MKKKTKLVIIPAGDCSWFEVHIQDKDGHTFIAEFSKKSDARLFIKAKENK